MAICREIGCQNNVKAASLCPKHYQRKIRLGGPTGARKYIRGSLKSKILARVEKRENSCWEWVGAHDKHGYGSLKHNGVVYYVHRASYEVWIGEIPDNTCVMHDCDNPKCCNPDHLSLGSRAENIKDCVIKGRNSFGERVPSSKLSSVQAKKVRRLCLEGAFTQSEIGKMFGITQSAVSRIGSGKSWARSNGVSLVNNR